MYQRQVLYTFYFIWITFCSYSQINNLNHPPGYQTSKWGELGEINVLGFGPKNVILLPGWGFDWSIFDSYIEEHKEVFTFYAITFPGFGKTAAPPMPNDPENFSDLYWTKGIIKGLTDLIDKRKIEDPIIISYFTYSNIIALRLALDYPDKIDKVIIISGMSKFVFNYPSYEPRNLNQRIYYTEQVLAKQWFRTVDKATWDKGNFTPITFTRDSIKALEYWQQMSAVPIPIMVRYLCEYYCTDLSLEYSNLVVPTLVVIPAFTNDAISNPNNFYLSSFFHDSWLGAKPLSKNLHLITISNSHAFILNDQPEILYDVMEAFIANKLTPFDVFR